MRVFLAGAGGAIGRRLTPLLVGNGHEVTGTTRSADKAEAIVKLGATPVVVDVFDAAALAAAVVAAKPQAVIHQLTDLAFAPGTPQYEEGLARNARLRIEGTANLVAAAKAAGVTKMIAQSIGWIYAPGSGARVETDPLVSGTPTATPSPHWKGPCCRCRKASYCVTAFSTVRAPGRATRRHARPRCMSMPPRRRHCSRSPRASPASTTSRRTRMMLSSEKAKRELGFDSRFRL